MNDRDQNINIKGKIPKSSNDLQYGNNANVNNDGVTDRLFVNSLARGLEILRCFTPEARILGKQDISRITGLPKATVFRLAHTLTELGYLRHSRETGKYQLAVGVLSFGHPYLEKMHTIEIAQPLMQKLADQVNCNVYLAVRDCLDMVILTCCKDSHITFSLNLHSGSRLPLATTSLGKSLLCSLQEEERDYLMNHIRRQNDLEWPKIKASIEQAMKDYKRWGFCLSIGGWRQDVNAVAVTINPEVGSGILTLCCAGPSLQLPQHILEEEIGPCLTHTARSIADELSRLTL